MSTESEKEKAAKAKAAKDKAAKLEASVADLSTFKKKDVVKWSEKKYKTVTGGGSNHTLPGMSSLGRTTRIKRMSRKSKK